MTEPTTPAKGFDDLLKANETFAARFTLSGFDGVAHRGVAVVTCMDSRIDPLRMLGLSPGDAKIFRRVLVVPHTRCAVASNSEDDLREKVGASAGKDASWISFGVIEDQVRTLRADVAKVRSHPLIAEGTLVGGFIYDVDTGLLRHVE